MSKVITTKVGSGITVPTITAENLGDSKAWAMAVTADSNSEGVSNEIRLRSYFLLGSVVDMKIAKAKDLVTDTACDKGLLSKGRTVAEFYVGQVTEGQELGEAGVTASHYAEALEICLSEHGSLYGAYTAIKGEKSPKELTTAELMAKTVKRALDEGYSIDQFVALAGKLFHEKSEMGEI
jgi:hypothetical protein